MRNSPLCGAIGFTALAGLPPVATLPGGTDEHGADSGSVTVRTVADLLEGEVACCEDALDEAVRAFAASDLLSDILALEKETEGLLEGIVGEGDR